MIDEAIIDKNDHHHRSTISVTYRANQVPAILAIIALGFQV
jgi:hypothetical protein